MTNQAGQDFRDAIEQRWDDYRKQFKAARQEISDDSIHDLRVAARRLQAVLNILRGLEAHARVKKLRRFLRKQLDHLDGLRDTQVMVQQVGSDVQSLPQATPFQDHLQARLENLRQKAQKRFHSSKPSDLKKRAGRIRNAAKDDADDPGLTEGLWQALDAAHAKTMQRFRKLDAQQPATIHRVRVAFKNFRYMMEIVAPFVPDLPDSYPGKMHAYQDAMGKVHDTSVLLDTLNEYKQSLQEQGQGPAFDAAPVEDHYRQRLEELIGAYFDRKDELNAYWRAAPDQPFPWETSHEPVHRPARNRRTTRQPQQRARRQPASADGHREKEVPEGRTGFEEAGNPDRPDTDQSVPTGG